MNPELLNSLVTAGTVGLVLAIFKLIQWYWNSRSEQVTKAAAQQKAPQGWADVTGEHRPVLISECAARHAQLTAELERGSEKMAKLDTTMQGVQTALVALKQEVGSGVELRIRKIAAEVVGEAVGRHEQLVVHRRVGKA